MAGMEIIGTDHVAIVVRDMDRATAWYEAHLGLTVLERAHVDGGIDIAYMAGPGLMLELFQRDGGQAPNDGKDPYEALEMRGIPHFAVLVADAEAYARALKDAGIEIILGPRKSPSIETLIFFVRDPDGNQIEFVERLSSDVPKPG